ncbi:hypothetical protein [Methanoregula sp. UBA64]|jgi:hypothetical protein|uniref:hypothetical protein n=1 Tax=Methanoregula sp. UBA64 TaxID=1915554 RepID=UPI0025EF82B9|nr:hypothetical protein [Methanoregula sp. UBA64]
MAGLNDDAQWIVLMGFVVSFSLFFLAMLLNQSTLVGQTTAEGVLDFPKNDIRDVKNVITESSQYSSDPSKIAILQEDIKSLALSRKGAVVTYTIIPTSNSTDSHKHISIHYNNGVTEYNEYWTSL